MNVLAELEHISKNYGKIKALDDVTLKVRKGEIFTLVGPNASGKTTLLKILACIEKPDSGNVYIRGKRVESRNRDRVKLSTTLVFQKTTLFSSSVYDNIAYGLRLRKMPKMQIDEGVRKALEMVKLRGYENRQAKKLSGGEQQRISLARALALNTPLLLLDEPTANLDPRSVSVIEEVIRIVNRQKSVTILMATHNVFQAERTARKAALLLGGRIVEMGAVGELLGGRSRNLAKFSRLENIFSGVSEVSDKGISRIRLDGGVVIESALRESGRVTVFVRPEDIIVSRGRFESSARNVFVGRVVGVSGRGSLVRLRVDAGEEFEAQVTRRSFVELRLNVGSRVFLTFKASSVCLV